MILILSVEQDATTDQVIDWIAGSGLKFTRLNDTSEITLQNYSKGFNPSIDLIYKNINGEEIEIKLEDVTSYWYRRGFLNIENNSFNKTASFTLSSSINNYISKSRNFINQSIHFELSKKKQIGNFNDNYINKLNVLSLASIVGLKIPHTEIINTKQKLAEFINIYKYVITKGIDNNSWGDSTSFEVTSNTVLLSVEDLEVVPDFFEYSLVQPLIEKYCEIRTFFLDGECYSSAIFSQGNEKTKIDYRNYDRTNPNRNVPYILPKKTSEYIKSLMSKLNLKTGSIDLILTPDNELVFLEVNPVGQFGGVSYRCNYYFEKKIANFLANE